MSAPPTRFYVAVTLAVLGAAVQAQQPSYQFRSAPQVPNVPVYGAGAYLPPSRAPQPIPRGPELHAAPRVQSPQYPYNMSHAYQALLPAEPLLKRGEALTAPIRPYATCILNGAGTAQLAAGGWKYPAALAGCISGW